MSRLTKHDRLAILELASEIAAESAQNPNIVWMIEFQEQLVAALYRKMTSLIEADLEMDEEEEDEDYEEEEDEEEAEESKVVVLESEDDEENKKKSKEKKAKKAA
jgi:hypothetical protein